MTVVRSCMLYDTALIAGVISRNKVANGVKNRVPQARTRL